MIEWFFSQAPLKIKPIKFALFSQDSLVALMYIPVGGSLTEKPPERIPAVQRQTSREQDPFPQRGSSPQDFYPLTVSQLLTHEMQDEKTGKWSKVLLNNFPELWMRGFKINDSRLLEMNGVSHLVLWVSRVKLIEAHKLEEII